TLGYAKNMKKVLKSAAKVLKPGGHIYIKDFFLVPLVTRHQEKVRSNSIKRIREEYMYKVITLSELINAFEDLGLFIVFVKESGFEEDFTKAAMFEQNNKDHEIYTKAIQN